MCTGYAEHGLLTYHSVNESIFVINSSIRSFRITEDFYIAELKFKWGTLNTAGDEKSALVNTIWTYSRHHASSKQGKCLLELYFKYHTECLILTI